MRDWHAVRRLLPLLLVPNVAAQNGTAEPTVIPLGVIISLAAVAVLVGVFVYLARR